ncbi:MAG: UDP-diphosphatase [Bacteroidetes bacterium GWE2_41_25]|nr:MAG: UDP-diphosphatase [Bacteroidetes bacterium GWA2_40_15]OFX93579.1 MAG: UDP-diphosphatase [Bacteroidetes bacterium GWC2_40_22]OFY12063.1 MAG: UDP-diphosphatase [Bacteroidetes bacterium GWE2_41_25]OFY58118.1 MAG: UDP-diphosphatase [Bacteroidetes bacterium GWF2_41_9]HAM11323.1 UDP-diphosphatase [Bacteroidales bacterium]
MNLLEAIILGLIQGLTEFLPVSSSGHLEIAKSLFGVDPDASFYFTVAVHGATVLSTILVFRQEILRLIRGSLKFQMNEETSYILKIIVSMIPVGIAGILLKEPIENLFNGNLVFVGFMLLITAAILAAAHFMKKGERSIGFKDAFIIGIAQAIAVIPGISRSGSTIATGLMIGNRKDEIAGFSFLMVLVPVIGANILEIFSGDVRIGNTGWGIIFAGFISAFISGYFACRWMITLVRKSKLIWFSLYCVAVGLLSILIG